MLSNIISVVEIVILLTVLGWLIYKGVKVLLPLLKNPDFFRTVIDRIAEAENKFSGTGRGKEKLEYVIASLLDYCLENNIDFTKETLERIVNTAVSVVNLIRAFISKNK